MSCEKVVKVPGYVGICASCFWPIPEGQEMKFTEDGRRFHKVCVQRDRNGYYVKLEELRARFKNSSDKEIPELIDDIRKFFSIPEVNDEEFNRENSDVIELYREVCDKIK